MVVFEQLESGLHSASANANAIYYQHKHKLLVWRWQERPFMQTTLASYDAQTKQWKKEWIQTESMNHTNNTTQKCKTKWKKREQNRKSIPQIYHKRVTKGGLTDRKLVVVVFARK